MIKNYFKLALRVLTRKKFFTFISLFGISFTLMILMLFASFFETELGDNPPLSKKDRMVFFNYLSMQRQYFDTIVEIDSNLLDGQMVYDTSYRYSSAGRSMSTSTFSQKFLEMNFADLENTENKTYINNGYTFDVYQNNSKLSISVGFCDHNYWKIFDHIFLHGRPFDEKAFSNGEPVTVITDKLSTQYFGVENSTGEDIQFDGRNFKVIGVIKQPTVSNDMVRSQAYVPYTLRRDEAENDEGYFGGFYAIILAKSISAISSIRDQISFKENIIPIPPEFDYDEMKITPMTYTEAYSRNLVYSEDPAKSERIVKWILIGLLSLFILLPSLNLINLNVSRILERSSEIGVRKAFGADRSTILNQFLIENIIHTLIGGIIGLILAILAIQIINDANLLQEVKLTINMKFFLLCLGVTLLFGIVSGLLPAYKMSKIQIVNALKSNQL